jgi:hypothetical protein
VTPARCDAQELFIDELPRGEEVTGAGCVGRAELDAFLAMAEHVAIAGLDDAPARPADAHYLAALHESAEAEPFPGFEPPQRAGAPPARRIECLTRAHRRAREVAAAAVAELETQVNSGDDKVREEIAGARARLARLGDAPAWAAPNSAEEFEAARECAAAPS